MEFGTFGQQVPQQVPPAYQPYQPYMPPQAPQVPPRPQGMSKGVLAALVVVAVLLLLSGSGVIYYSAVFRPNQLHAQATATAVVQAQGTARANAQATSTAVAYANATATVDAQVQATATALDAIYTQATAGTPTLDDPLNANGANNWTEYSTAQQSCAFKGGALHALSQNTGTVCFAQNTSFNNFAYTVKMVINSGSVGGVVFRANVTSSTNVGVYLFSITTGGKYILGLIQGTASGSTATKDLGSNQSSTINTASAAVNELGVVARGSTIYLFINKHYVAQVTDAALTTGMLGVFGGTQSDSNSDVSFTDLQVWQL